MLTSEIIKGPTGRNQEILRGGQGPAVVFLHGIARIDVNDPLLNALAETHSVIAPVAPGYNDIREVDDIPTIHDLALFYDSLFTSLNLDRLSLVGHSFGGMIAAEVAAHVPARVSRLALIAPIGLWNDEYPVEDLVARPYDQINALIWQGAIDASGKAGDLDIEYGSQAGFAVQGQDALEKLVSLASGLASVCMYTWPIPDKGLHRRLYRITAPSLILFGENDAYVPARYADDFVKGIRDARKTLMPGSHMVPYERPAAVAHEVGAFLAG